MNRRIDAYERGGGPQEEDDEEDDRPVRREQPPLTILRKDARIVVVAKPSGLPTIPERFAKGATAVSETWKLLRREEPGCAEPRVVHRLDRDTSGVLLLARDADAARDLMQAFEEKRVAKSYLALTLGAPQPTAGELVFLVDDDPRRAGAMRVVASGEDVAAAKERSANRGAKECVSAWETVETFRGIALVRVRPKTGRTHQVRLTLLHLGTPCAIDPLYGSAAPLLLSAWKRDYRVGKWTKEVPLTDRLTLHAESLTFPHPDAPGGDASPVTVECPLPRDLAGTLKQLRRWAAPGTL
jgi:23S rRNA pseudouridine955/2504/2580 synthase/23S rRNA pseudouridine1911/1915/1917 synthase